MHHFLPSNTPLSCGERTVADLTTCRPGWVRRLRPSPPTKARSSGSDASGGSEDEDSATLCPPAKRSKGITWVGTRKTWVVRYKGPEGRCHSKRFRASSQAGDDCEKARDDALKLAEEWLEGHHEAVGLGC